MLGVSRSRPFIQLCESPADKMHHAEVNGATRLSKDTSVCKIKAPNVILTEDFFVGTMSACDAV